MKFKGEYKITIEDSGDKSIKKKDYEYEENRMKD